MKNTDILIVEDESLVALDLKRSLIKLGYSVTAIIRYGEEVLNYLDSDKPQPDLILMDIMLAGKMDGTYTAGLLRKKKNIPVIYITAYSDDHTFRSARLTNPFGYILKPFDERILYTTIELALYRHQLEIEKAEYTQKLRELNRSKDKFFSLISHDLRSPFHSILGSVEILKNEYNALNEEERSFFIDSVYGSVKNIYDHLNDLLDYSQTKMNGLYSPGKVFLNYIISKAVNLYSGAALRKNIGIVTQIDENLAVFAEEDMLLSIFQNLISNAVKFTRRGGCIDIRSFKNGKYVVTEVRDNGIGIDEVMIKNLFNIETRYSTPGTDNEPGTGLGLIIVKELADKAGGSIQASSSEKEGSCFTVNLPEYT